MLFSAGFGVGLVFWGVAEPMSHYFTSPIGGIEPQSEQAARVAMGYSFFHWGISQWAIFGIVGLVIGFLQFRKKKDGLISTALEPLVGSNRKVKIGIDSFAVIATVMGIATSLGLGILQMSGGLESVFHIENTFGLQLIIIFVVFVAYMLSASSGLNKGIRYLGNFNLGMAIAMLVFFFIVGPKVFILESFTLAIGDYITNFIQYSLRLQPYQGGTWVRDWTIFYWAWTIAWSPFVGAFVARVSKGRTIREFIAGVMVIPPVFACMWIATLGGTALHSDLNNGTKIAEAVDDGCHLCNIRDVPAYAFHRTHVSFGNLIDFYVPCHFGGFRDVYFGEYDDKGKSISSVSREDDLGIPHVRNCSGAVVCRRSRSFAISFSRFGFTVYTFAVAPRLLNGEIVEKRADNSPTS